MKALVVNTPSGPAVQLRELPTPVPGPGQACVRVRAVSLNRRDLAFLHGAHPLAPDRPIVAASDMCGEVVAVGAGVRGLAPGARVVNLFLPAWQEAEPPAGPLRPAFGGPDDGVACAYRVFDARALLPAPAHLTDAEAACLPCATLTAWAALAGFGADLDGATVVAPGSGGVATAILQIARARGARVLMVSRGGAKRAALLALGANEVIDRTASTGWARRVLDLTDGRGAEVVIEHGGAFAEALECVAAGGLLSLVGDGAAEAVALPLRTVFTRRLRLHGVAGGGRTMMSEMHAFLTARGLRPIHQPPFPLHAADQAYAALERGDGVGNICLAFGDGDA